MRKPNNSQRLNIYGKTGSGKTVAGLWHLEQRTWPQSRWGILDFKRDPTIRRIPRLQELNVTDKLPNKKQGGLYVWRPRPDQGAEVEDLLWRIWSEENFGLFLDEAYMIPKGSAALKAIYTQGRSKKIPTISLTQRPAWVNPFMMSEADFHQVFHIPKPDDFKTLREWVPQLRPTRQNYHSQYYDVGKDRYDYLAPVPDEEEILDRFDARMPYRPKLFTGFFTIEPNSKLKPKRTA